MAIRFDLDSSNFKKHISPEANAPAPKTAEFSNRIATALGRWRISRFGRPEFIVDKENLNSQKVDKTIDTVDTFLEGSIADLTPTIDAPSDTVEKVTEPTIIETEGYRGPDRRNPNEIHKFDIERRRRQDNIQN